MQVAVKECELKFGWTNGGSITFLWDKNIVMLIPCARRSPHEVVHHLSYRKISTFRYMKKVRCVDFLIKI